MTDEILEAQLRRSAPALPPALRSATLTRCAEQARIQRHKERNQLRFVYALAGMCALQLVVGNQLDSQRAALLSGESASPSITLASVPDLPKRLQERARLIAKLMVQPYNGRSGLRQV